MGPINYTLPFHHHLPSWFQERQSIRSLTTAWILTQLQNNEPIISPTLILAPVQWDIMTKITNAKNLDPPPLNCSPGKSYVLLFLCSPLCFWWPNMQADTTTHVQNGSTMVPPAIYQKPIPQCPWSHISIDFVTNRSISQGHNTLLTVVDCFSKACQLIPLLKLPAAFENHWTSVQLHVQIIWLTSSSSRFICHIHDYTESINQQWNVSQVRSMDSAIL